MQAIAYTKTGSKAVAAPKLSKAIFGEVPENHELLNRAYVAYMANGRVILAQTKTRGLVRGGGRKPWKQKGTGRARFGSIRTPLWRGGGIIFGPTGGENYSKKLSTTAKRKAISQALSLCVNENRLKVIEAFDCKEGKVKQTIQLMDKLDAKGNVLIVVSLKDKLVERASRNLPKIKAIQAEYLNVFDLLNADTVVISEAALIAIEKWLSPSPRLRRTGGGKQ